jgi:hypothetical protein
MGNTVGMKGGRIPRWEIVTSQAMVKHTNEKSNARIAFILLPRCSVCVGYLLCGEFARVFKTLFYSGRPNQNRSTQPETLL